MTKDNKPRCVCCNKAFKGEPTQQHLSKYGMFCVRCNNGISWVCDMKKKWQLVTFRQEMVKRGVITD